MSRFPKFGSSVACNGFLLCVESLSNVSIRLMCCVFTECSSAAWAWGHTLHRQWWKGRFSENWNVNWSRYDVR
eukprot:5808392-Amphidinium_carterae.1